VTARPAIVCLERQPTEEDAALLRPGRRIAHLGDAIDGSPGVLVGDIGADDVPAALAAVLQGWDLVIRLKVRGEPRRLVLDDLRHLGDVVEPGGDPAVLLDPVDQQLLEQLAAGKTVRQAARACGMSDRTAARRLAVLRKAFGVETNAGVLARWQADSLPDARPAPGS